LSSTLLTGMTGISLQMKWPQTSQSYGSFLKENNFFVTDQTPWPYPTRSLPAQGFKNILAKENGVKIGNFDSNWIY
jgi:hypothetical protein